MTRAGIAGLLLAAFVYFPHLALSDPAPRRVVVLGIDGMDHALTRRLMEAGRLPHLKQLADSGSFLPLETTIPPQSPVAWSTFAVGAGAGVHGIADFIHRDPHSLLPTFSMSRVWPAERRVNLGPISLPLSGSRTELLRRGTPFWDYFCDPSIPARIIRLPSNFPPGTRCPCVQCLAGMGTPDVLGGYGTFTFFSSARDNGEVSGGVIRRIVINVHVAEALLPGPGNDLRVERTSTSLPLRVIRDPEKEVAVIEHSGKEILLRKGEWSEWQSVRFPMLGAVSGVSGICRFFLAAVHPHLELYVSPVNIDPQDPALPISEPPEFSRELAESSGRFYTQGMPEDTKALSAGVLSDEEYWDQANLVLDESLVMFHRELRMFRQGLLFFYFSTVDQCSHAFWRQFDPTSPTHNADFQTSHGSVIETLYERMDQVVGQARKTLSRPDDVLLVMSDHGFAPFKREVELNQWLRREGYLAVKPQARLRDANLDDFEWSRTQAYNIGLNGVYLNVAGRERLGTIPRDQATTIARKLAERLLRLKDPESGQPVVSRVWLTADIYPGPEQANLPDLIVGFRPPYRISWGSALGNVASGAIVKPNLDKWSGDHCVDPEFVPGVLFSSVPLLETKASLQDVAPTLLHLYGIGRPDAMSGRSLLRTAGTTSP